MATISRIHDEFEARLAGVHRRYSSPPVAVMKRGTTYWSVPPTHHAIVGEASIEGDRARLLTTQEYGMTVYVTLERGARGWRIVKEEYDFGAPA